MKFDILNERVKKLTEDKKTIKIRCIHAGHRKRLKEIYKQCGFDVMPQHNLLELLLFFGIPYKDTNKISHDLLNKFGSWDKVFEADMDSLKSVSNMTENAALLIKLVSDISKKYHYDETLKNNTVYTEDDIDSYLRVKYAGITEEVLFLIIFDKDDRIADSIQIGTGNESMSEINLSLIVKLAGLKNSHSVSVVHNHPNGSGVSSNDIVSSRQLAFHLKGVDIELRESYVYTRGEIYRIMKTVYGSAAEGALAVGEPKDF